MAKVVDQSPTRVARKADLDRTVAMRLAATEYDRVVGMLEALTPEQWQVPTECQGWNVRAMAGHILGMTQMAATIRESMRLRLILEGFNIFNRANVATVNTNLFSGRTAAIVGGVQTLTLTSPAPSAAFGLSRSFLTPRELQLAIKFDF